MWTTASRLSFRTAKPACVLGLLVFPARALAPLFHEQLADASSVRPAFPALPLPQDLNRAPGPGKGGRY